MKTSIRSLRNLPPQQALALALAEKARRVKAQQMMALSMMGTASPAQQALDVLASGSHLHGSLLYDPGHPYYCLLHRPARYKILWGGRGSAKSWSVAEALIRKAATTCIRVMCCRENQNTIKDSAHRLLKDTINRLGLSGYFTVTNEEIRSRTGSLFIFKGLWNNEESVKSTEAIDICWVEEAQTVSDVSWRTLIPTIRNLGSEIWVTFNLLDENDATYQRFVHNRRTDSIVFKVNFDACYHCLDGGTLLEMPGVVGNPYFHLSPLYQDMLDDKAANFHMYEHVWLGFPLTIDDSMVFGGKYVVEDFPDDLWTKAERLHYGADFGFAKDPSTLIRDFVYDRKLYIEYEAWGLHVELDDYGEFYARVPGSKDWPIFADCARPETISHIRRNWQYNIHPCDKWDGCVKDGVAHIRKFDAVVIHPRCKETAKEARLYRYKVDKRQLDDKGNPMVLPIIIDKHNHCWDGVRYSLNGHIQKSGEMGIWERLGQQAQEQT